MKKLLTYIIPIVFLSLQGLAINLDNAFFSSILDQLKNLKSTAYDYSLEANFGTGHTEKIIGRSYFDAEKSFVFNSNKAATILYNGQWYINANHLKRQVVIYQMGKRFGQNKSDSMKKDIFRMGVYTEWVDSVVRKYGRFANGKMISKNVVKFDILFRPNDMIQSITMEYDIKKGIPVKCTIVSYYSSEYVDGVEKNITQTMICTNYSKKLEGSDYDIYSYFKPEDSEGKKIILKRFRDYKLITIK